MSKPKVSVLMAVYNNDSTVDTSIRSIAEQTFGDWEMILWNDKSTDETLNKLLSWQQQDSRIRVFSNSSNLGLAASLNKAFAMATGQYIARMDGDDVAAPQRFAKQINFLDENDQYAIVSSACVLFDDLGEWGIRKGLEAPRKEDFLWGSQFLHPAVMMRREALAKVGGYRISIETLRTEDYDLFMRMYQYGYKGYNQQETLLHYFENRKPKHVKYCFRWREVRTRWRGFKALGLLPKGWPYVLKPLVIGMIPGKLKRILQQRRSSAMRGGRGE